ncbi:ribosome biogenesis GTPase Der [Peptostreptococcaceae bacterium oral taxon 929]|uniref:GTPase Der n=1 Tax=Fenollaria massiliensis TaxID=938288 RepID=A0A9E7IVG4_9FIRM|nr:ribosome biogenesis GTPase Der [Fenollaria massiliensis]AVM66718.1 ribosome biogenesis GTPase Der [Peptostreptococcaceae bacterium oral taxon 929]OFK80719.1 ribosome biogenesis GTPase Der [Anaerosphaera sp. HMSC064C01]UQK59618.1 ribosome biogenesis GTPase Der [Fenollaria massiliensis]
MNRAVVSIVGKPNVGKSTLFNKIVGRRISITEDTPGVTRDRIYAEASWQQHVFDVIDTGGLDPFDDDKIMSNIRKQANIAIEASDVILFIVDGRNPATALDHEIANILRKSNKKIILVANKTEGKRKDEFYNVYELALGEPMSISAEQGLGIGDLLDEIIKNFPEDRDFEEKENLLKVAFIGKPNVGKSSLTNRILGEERVIVTDIAGTTRDAIDSYINIKGQEFMFIDTAGLRKKSRVDSSVEAYSQVRTLSSVDRADVCVFLIDAVEGFTEQDSKVVGYAHNQGKAIIICVNKWDIVEKDSKTMKTFTDSLRNNLPFLSYAPILFISALTGKRVDELIDKIMEINESYSHRLSTGLLNDIISNATLINQPPSDKGKRLKILYATQSGTRPPEFTIFVNDKELTHFSYTRFLENQIRNVYPFEGTSIIINYKNRSE